MSIEQFPVLTLAIHAAARAVPWQYGYCGAKAEVVDEALGIAFEHCIEAAGRGQSPHQTLDAIGVCDASRLTTWGDAIGRLVAIWLTEVWPNLPDCHSRGPP